MSGLHEFFPFRRATLLIDDTDFKVHREDANVLQAASGLAENQYDSTAGLSPMQLFKRLSLCSKNVTTDISESANLRPH